MEHEHKDLVKVIAEHFEEEIEDACEYAKLAEEFPDEQIALWELGREEATHANYLHNVLKRHHSHIPEEHEEKFHRMMRKFHFEK